MESKSNVLVALAGDVMLGRLVNEAIRHFGAAYPWGDFQPLLAGADVTIVNLECVIATNGRPWGRTAKVFHFRADPVAFESLHLAGVDATILANNHVLDWEVESLFEMLQRLDEHGIAHAGAGRDHAEAEKTAFLVAKGLRIGIVAITDNEPGWAAGRHTPGTNYAPVSVRPTDFVRIEGAIARARAGADVVIFSNHWGPNMRVRPPRHFRAFAHAVLDAGADVYFGHSAHVFQGIEVYRGKPLIYDAGDFVDDYAVDPVLRNDRGLLYLLTVDVHGAQQLELVPALIEDCQVNRARGQEFDVIAARIQQLSAEFGTTVAISGDRLGVDLAAGAQRRAA